MIESVESNDNGINHIHIGVVDEYPLDETRKILDKILKTLEPLPGEARERVWSSAGALMGLCR